MFEHGPLAAPLAFVLAASAAAASPAPFPRGDDPTPVWSVEHATQAPAYARGLDTAAAGSVAVTVGELRDQVATTAKVRVAFARAFERDTGIERWRWDDARARTALGVAVDPTGQRAFVVTRDPAHAGDDGTEWLVALDTASGAPLFETQRTLDASDPRSFSTPDALRFDASGNRLARLDHFGPLGTSQLRVELIDPLDGSVQWTFERAGLDPVEHHASPATGSLAFAPNGQVVYVTYTTFEAGGGSSLRDAHVVALDAANGAELWTRSFATPSASDHVSPPMPSVDGNSVFVATHVATVPSASSNVVALSALNGTTVWSVPIADFPMVTGLAPNGERVVVAGRVDAGAFDGYDLSLSAVDTTTGALAWSFVESGVGTHDEPTDLGFAPDSSRAYLAVERGSTAFPYEPWTQVVGVRPSDGAARTFTDALPATNWSLDAHFVDVVTTPGGSLATAGHAVVDQSIDVGNGLDRRIGCDHTGALVFDRTDADTFDEDSDAFGRVWLSADGSEVIVWASEHDELDHHAALRIERRRTSDGGLIASHGFGAPAVGSTAYLPTVSPDGAYVAFQDLVGVQLVVRVFDLASGAEVFTTPAPLSVANIHLTWSADSTRVGWATKSPNVYMGVGDVTTGQLLWQQLAGTATTVYSFTSVRGIAFDPVDGSLNVLFNATTGLVQQTHEFILARRDGTTGQLVWELVYSSEGSLERENTFQSVSAAASHVYYGAAPPGLATAPDGSVVYTADLFAHPLRTITRIAASRSSDGAHLWNKGSFFGPGKDARLVGLVPSRDGRFVHVLSEGRGDLASNPKRAYVSTHVAATGDFYWQRFLDDDVALVRRLISIGEGGRIAIVSTRAAADGSPDGTLVTILDAPTGAELGRLEAPGIDAESIDAAIDDFGRLFTAGARTGGALGADGLLERHDLATLQFGPHERSISTGGRSAATLDFDPAYAGLGYLLVGSLSGTSPGIPLGGGLALPLVHDAYTDFTLLAVNTTFFSGSLGVLDVAGDGEAAVLVPPSVPPAFVGTTFHYAAFAFDPVSGAPVATTDSVDLSLLP